MVFIVCCFPACFDGRDLTRIRNRPRPEPLRNIFRIRAPTKLPPVSFPQTRPRVFNSRSGCSEPSGLIGTARIRRKNSGDAPRPDYGPVRFRPPRDRHEPTACRLLSGHLFRARSPTKLPPACVPAYDPETRLERTARRLLFHRPGPGFQQPLRMLRTLRPYRNRTPASLRPSGPPPPATPPEPTSCRTVATAPEDRTNPRNRLRACARTPILRQR